MTSNTSPEFVLFDTNHLTAMLLIAFVCVFFPLAMRRVERQKTERTVAVVLGATLLINELVRIYIRVALYDHPLANELPLQLCGLEMFLVSYVLIRRSYRAFEIAYFWGLGATAQAILTPDLQYGFPSLGFAIFFVSHGLSILGVFYALIVYRFRPTIRSVAKTLAITCALIPVYGLVNIVFGTNYLYLRHKPQQASIMDHLGPWPWYILSLVLIGIVICLVLYLPFAVLDWRSRRRATQSRNN